MELFFPEHRELDVVLLPHELDLTSMLLDVERILNVDVFISVNELEVRIVGTCDAFIIDVRDASMMNFVLDPLFVEVSSVGKLPGALELYESTVGFDVIVPFANAHTDTVVLAVDPSLKHQCSSLLTKLRFILKFF